MRTVYITFVYAPSSETTKLVRKIVASAMVGRSIASVSVAGGSTVSIKFSR